jgi:hypothetical protein
MELYPHQCNLTIISFQIELSFLGIRIEDENVWLTQKQIAQLFDVDVRTVNEHLVNIFSEKELEEEATIRKFRIVQKEAAREVE